MACPRQVDTKMDLQTRGNWGRVALGTGGMPLVFTWVYSQMGISLKSLFLVYP